jgi:RimJ/RimL family protein N-acetyltransferase
MVASSSELGGAVAALQAETLAGRRIRLRGPRNADLDYLWTLARSDPSFVLTLSLASSGGAEEMSALLRSGRLCHYIVELASSRRPVGYVVAHSRPPAAAGVARVGVFMETPFRRTSIGIEAGALVVERLFDVGGVRRVEAPTYDDGLSRISTGLDRLFHQDAVLREASFAMGRFWDLHVLSLDRAEWQERAPRFTSWLRGERQV